jgi:hypothetical protein
VETVDFGDGTPPQTFVGADQGCFQGNPCLANDTVYSLGFTHVYRVTGVYTTRVTVNDEISNDVPCTIAMPVTVTP